MENECHICGAEVPIDLDEDDEWFIFTYPIGNHLWNVVACEHCSKLGPSIVWEQYKIRIKQGYNTNYC